MGQHFNEAKELAEQRGDEHKVGAITYDCIALIPLADRLKYLPIGEVQRGAEDTCDCASRAPVNILEAKFTYLYRNNLLTPESKKWLDDNGYVVLANGGLAYVTFSDAFVAIGSGTTREGNSLKAPLDFIHNNGLIPKKLLPLESWMTFDQYHDKNRVTQAMRDLGAEFKQRFPINYAQVPNTMLDATLDKDAASVALFGWSLPVNGIYPRDDRPFTHAAALVGKPSFVAFDNYLDQTLNDQGLYRETAGDFTKQLAPDYKFWDWGYRVMVVRETPAEELRQSSLFTLALQWVVKIVAWLQGDKQGPLPAPPPEIIVNPTPMPPSETPAQRIVAAAKVALGTDPTPGDAVPDEVACVNSLVAVMPAEFGIPKSLAYTPALLSHLRGNKKFKEVKEMNAGSLVVFPTQSNIVGHALICLENDDGTKTHNTLASNNSFGGVKGLFTLNYSRKSARAYFIAKKGLIGLIFEPV